MNIKAPVSLPSVCLKGNQPADDISLFVCLSSCSSTLPFISPSSHPLLSRPWVTICTPHVIYVLLQWNLDPRCRQLLSCSWRSAAPGTTVPPWPGGWLCPLATPSRATSWSWTMAMEDSTGSVSHKNTHWVILSGRWQGLTRIWQESNLKCSKLCLLL